MDKLLDILYKITPWNEELGEIFRFRDPWWLLLLLLIPILSILFGRLGRRAAIKYSSTLIVRQLGKRTRQRAGGPMLQLRWLILGLLICALARPQFGTGFTESTSSGIDIVLAVDLSQSMLALDMEPPEVAQKRLDRGEKLVTRLDAVKDVILEFIESRPEDRIGLIAFGADPYLISPLSLNHEWLNQQVKRLEIGLIDGTSTNIGGAITMSANRLSDLANAKDRVVVLLTDGEQTTPDAIDPALAAEAAAALDVKIYTIAAGTDGVVYTYSMDQRTGRLQTNRAGQPFIQKTRSSYDAETLEKVAEITKARFFVAGNKEELQETYKEIDELEKTDVDITFRTNFEDMYFWPACIGLILLGLEQLLKNTRFRTLP